MNVSLAKQSFLVFLGSWFSNLPGQPIGQAITNPNRAAIIAIDVTNGFCKTGPLSSPRVARIVAPIVRLFERSWHAGVRHILLPQDAHATDAVEFAQWPPHCVAGSDEAETVSEIKTLLFFNQMVILPKNSINPSLNSTLPDWLKYHPEVDTFIIAGDCTDLCTYQLAMYIRTEANASQKQRRVIVPADCVDTYDMPVEQATKLGILPHPAEIIHAFFLYHMALNGVEVCSGII